MMQPLNLFDETFDQDRTASYILSIQACLDGFYFAIFDTVRNTYIGLIVHPVTEQVYRNDGFVEIFTGLEKEYPWIKCEFKEVWFSFLQSSFTVAPKSFVNETSAKKIFETVHVLEDNRQLQIFNCNNGVEVSIIYDLPTVLANDWLKLQPKTNFIPAVLPLCDSSKIVENEISFNASIQNETLLFSAFDGEKLLLANSYACKNPIDITYYLLSVASALKADVKQVNLFLLGSSEFVSKQHELATAFKKYNTIATYRRAILFTYRLLRYRSEFYNLFAQPFVCE